MKIISARTLVKQEATIEPASTTPAASPQAPIETTVQAPDLAQELLDVPLEEGQGLNSGVEEVAEWAVDATQTWIGENVYHLLDSMTQRMMNRFGSPQLVKNAIGNFVIELIMRPARDEYNLVQITDGEIKPFGQRYLITVYIDYNAEFRGMPERQQAQELKNIAFDPHLKSVFVHEITHAQEDSGRIKNGASTVFQDNSQELARQFLEDPILKNIGRRIYLAADSEMSARVAEVASIMQATPSDSGNKDVLLRIKETRIWREIKFLNDFPAEAAYAKIMENAQREYANELPEGDAMATEALIAEKIRDALYQMRFDGGPQGHSQTNNRLIKILSYRINGDTAPYRIKELKDILKGLEVFFKQKADELKKRVFKTIALVKDKMQTKTPFQVSMETELDEENLVESYPESFDMGDFRDLNNFTERIRYCNDHLKRIASGSSRIVYEIDADKVLKLAKNTKGIAQNELEAQYMFQQDYGDLVAKVYDTHPRELWVEMEKAEKITPTKFQQLTGVDLKNLGIYLCNRSLTGYRVPQDPRIVAIMEENEFVRSLLQMVNDCQLHPGDMERATTWGLVKRDGHELVVLVDFGLNQDGYEAHYANPSTSSRNRHQAYNE